MTKRIAIFLLFSTMALAQRGGQPPVPVMQYSATASPVTIKQVADWISSTMPQGASFDGTALGLNVHVQHYATAPDRFRITFCQGPIAPCAQPFNYEAKIGTWQDENGQPREEFRVQRVVTTKDLTPTGVK